MSNSLGSALTAGGGLSPAQAALPRYTTAEQEVANAGAFGRSGMPMSTGLTQTDAGAQAAGALQAAQLSDQEAAAQSAFINNQFSQFSSGLGSLLGGIGGKSGSGG